MLNVYCRFICHHELNCDLFLSFPPVLYFLSNSRAHFFPKQTQNPCRKAAALDAIDWTKTARQENILLLFEEWNVAKCIDEMSAREDA